MYNLELSLTAASVNSLDAAMRAEFDTAISGISYNPIGDVLTVHFFEAYTSLQEAAAQLIVDAHDPVYLAVGRTGNTVTVIATKPLNLDSATEVTLTVDGQSLPSASPLSTAITLNSPDTITIGVETYPCDTLTI